jgi:predicted MFS family arabinose efflux permease
VREATRSATRRVVLGAAVSTALASLPVFLLGGLAVLAREDLHFGELQLGLAVSAFFTVAALAAVPAGRVATRTGARRATVLAAGLSGLALLVMALAGSYPLLVAALAVAGVANALAQIGSNHALASTVRPGRQGLAFGIKQSAVPAATLVAGLALPLVGLTLGWRATFAAAAVLAAGYVLVAPPPVSPGSRGGAQRDRSGDAAPRPLAVLAVAAGLAAAAANALAAFLVASSVSTGLSASAAGLLLAGGSVLGVTMRLLVGWWADRRAEGHLLLVAAMLGAGSLGLALLGTSRVWALLLGTTVAFSLGWSWPGLLTFAVVRLNPGAPAVATSITQTGVFAGSAAGPLLFGLTVELTSYAVAWTSAAAALLSASALVLLGRRMLLAERTRRAAAG